MRWLFFENNLNKAIAERFQSPLIIESATEAAVNLSTTLRPQFLVV
jgi:hypothetical protein